MSPAFWSTRPIAALSARTTGDRHAAAISALRKTDLHANKLFAIKATVQADPTEWATVFYAGRAKPGTIQLSEPGTGSPIRTLLGVNRLDHIQVRSVAMRTIFIFVSSVLMACAAFAQPRRAPSTEIPSVQDFVNKVAISDMFEIQSSQLALSKEPDKDTKPFAQRMVSDHQKTSSESKSLIDAGKVNATLPTALDSEHHKMLDDLKAKSGKDFDQSYDQTQVQAHEDAVALFDAYAKGGEDAALKRWAAKTLPHLKQHLKMAQKLK
jgi:putative membrane protein